MANLYLALAGLSAAMVVVGAVACLAGADYGIGLMVLMVAGTVTVFWVLATFSFGETLSASHHHLVQHHPRVLKLVPLKVAKLQARRARSYQTQVDSYLTILAKFVRGDRCEHCGTVHPMLRRYPFDPHFHDRDCAIALGFQQFGNVDLCPWAKLFTLPQPVLLGRLSDESKRGIQYYAYQRAVTYGYGTEDYFHHLGVEYLRLYATDAPVEHVVQLGQKVAAECGIEEMLKLPTAT